MFGTDEEDVGVGSAPVPGRHEWRSTDWQDVHNPGVEARSLNGEEAHHAIRFRAVRPTWSTLLGLILLVQSVAVLINIL